MTRVKELTIENIEEIRSVFKAVFTGDPWNDDWSDEKQLSDYIKDLIGNPNSLTFGLLEEDELIGLSMGNIRHWYSGTEYYINEFCINTKIQGRGLGTYFIKCIEEEIKERGVIQIFLQTERSVPAFQFYRKNGFLEMTDQVSLAKRLTDTR